MLDLVDTPRRQVALTQDGRAFAQVDIEERHRIFCKHCLELGIFRHITSLLTKQTSKTLDREIIDEFLILQMPQEDHQRQFELLMGWGQFAGLFSYEETTDTIVLEQDKPAVSGVLPNIS